MENYAFAIIDLSYLLQRNLYVISRDKDFTSGDLVRMTMLTLNKLPRDFGLKASKFIFLADKWSEEYGGYYRHFLLSGGYKTDRTWMTQEKVDALKSSPDSTPEEIEKAQMELRMNLVMTEAKRVLKEELGNFGVPCLWQDGWEFDDCAYLFACLWYKNPDPRKSVIVTQDSDLMYSINPRVDYFKLPRKGCDPEVITYQDMYYKIPEKIRDFGVSLYDYKSMSDSLGAGHNSLKRTKKYRTGTDKVICEILSGDFSSVEDPDLFRLQYSTFDLSHFPGLQEIKEKLGKDIFRVGRLSGVKEFRSFCEANGIRDLSDDYYRSFISRFDPKLFTE